MKMQVHAAMRQACTGATGPDNKHVPAVMNVHEGLSMLTHNMLVRTGLLRSCLHRPRPVWCPRYHS
jgi:hypothetical protein